MSYKILINSKGVPVLVEVPDKSFYEYGHNTENYEFHERDYEQALSTALADESKHIAFSNVKQIQDLLFQNNEILNGDFKNHIGQTFDLPIGYSVSFEGEWRHNQFATWHSYVGREAPDGSETRTVAILTPKENSAHYFTEGADVPVNEKEKASYWYNLGAGDGSLGSADFEKAWNKTFK